MALWLDLSYLMKGIDMKNPMTSLLLCVGLLLVVAGCKEDADRAEAPPAPAATPADTLPAGLIATTQPSGDAQDVIAAKTSAKDGEPVIVRGTVAGTADPLAPNRAMLTLLDSSIKTCDTLPGDSCKTPWDACCEPANVLAASTASVQVTGPDGKPLKTTLEGVGGIKPLSKLVVAGTARKPADGETLQVDAAQIYVVP